MPASAGIYYYRRVVSGNSCPPSVSDSVAIIIDPKADPGSIDQDAIICENAIPKLSNNISASGGRGNGTYRYSWLSSATPAGPWQVVNTSAVFEDFINPGPPPAKGITYYSRRVTSGTCQTQTLPVKIETIPGIDPGSISKDSVFCSGQDLAPINSIRPASGGTGGNGNEKYLWFKSSNGINGWVELSTENGQTLTLPELNGVTYFKRRAQNGPAACDTNFTNVIRYERAIELEPGRIGPDSLAPLCVLAVPQNLINLDSAKNGTPSSYDRLTFTWEQKTEGADFTAIPGSNHLTLEASPDLLDKNIKDTTTYIFRRKVDDAKCGPAKYSNELKLIVYPVTKPEAVIENPGTICQLTKDTIEVTVQNGGKFPAYEWFYNKSNTAVSSDSVFVNTKEWDIPTTLKVIITPSKDECSSGPAEHEITFTPVPKQIPKVSIVVKDSLCSLNSGELVPVADFTFKAVGIPASKGNTYTYSHNGNLVANTGDSLHIMLKSGDEVTVLLHSDSECALAPISDPVTRKVTVIETPLVSLSEPGIICKDSSTVINSEGGRTNSQYTWFFNGEILPFSTDSIPVQEQGQYVLTVLNGNKCSGSDTVNLLVEEPVVNIEQDVVDMDFGKSAVVSALLNYPASLARWTPQDSIMVVDTLHQNFVINVNPYKTTKYQITLTSPIGCMSKDEVLVRVFKPIHVPNAFSPNGDSNNESWVIEGLETYPEAEVKIFNRWGNIVYQSTGYLQVNEWKGESNGEPVPAGTYYYIIDPKHEKGGGVYTGNLTVIK